MKVLFKFTHTLVGQRSLSYARQESQLMDRRLGAGTRVSQAWPVLRFQFKALTHLPASFPSRLFHEVGIPWVALRLAVCLKWGTEERRRKRCKDGHFPNPGKLWKKYQTVCKPKRWAAVNMDLLKASHIKRIFPFVVG